MLDCGHGIGEVILKLPPLWNFEQGTSRVGKFN